MGFTDDRNYRNHMGAGLIFLSIVGLMIFLFFFEIPAGNNSIFELILGVIVGSLSVVIYTLVGKEPEELHELKVQNEKLKVQNEQLKQRINHLEEMFIDLQNSVINELSVISAPK